MLKFYTLDFCLTFYIKMKLEWLRSMSLVFQIERTVYKLWMKNIPTLIAKKAHVQCSFFLKKSTGKTALYLKTFCDT